jgi:hypothetical protein
LADSQPLQGGDLVDDVEFHSVLLSGDGERSTGVDSEPQFADKFKAIRDKRERLFGRGKWRDEVGFLRWGPA